jgi:hypothetical protein
MQEAFPSTLGIDAAKAMDSIELADQSINSSAVDLFQGTATNRAQMMRHTLTSFLQFICCA